MGNTALLVIIIALVLYRWFPITDDRLLVLMESKTNDPNKLNEIHGLISAFKIDHSLDDYWRDIDTQNEKRYSNSHFLRYATDMISSLDDTIQ